MISLINIAITLWRAVSYHHILINTGVSLLFIRFFHFDVSKLENTQ